MTLNQHKLYQTMVRMSNDGKSCKCFLSILNYIKLFGFSLQFSEISGILCKVGEMGGGQGAKYQGPGLVRGAQTD